MRRTMQPKPATAQPLRAEFFARDTRDVARGLIGATISHDGVSGVIVETEAYRDDSASHWIKRPRTARLMGESHARLYVYRIYGVHLCLNVTTEVDHPGAVLIRALAPTGGIETMRERRAGRSDRELTSGPARLVQALGVEARWNGHAFDADLIWTQGTSPPNVVTGPRVGISTAQDLPWRFMAADSPYVSRGGASRRERA